jgi:formyltetrahydrofolate deformylase
MPPQEAAGNAPPGRPARALVILLACPDRPGIVAAVTEALLLRGWNILSLEEHVEGGDAFFMRILAEATDPAADRVRPELVALGDRFGGTVRLHDPRRQMRAGLLVTREPACAMDLLVRARLEQLPGLVPIVVGNRGDLAWLGEMFDVEFHHVPDDDQRAHEQRAIELLEGAGVELVVLARYMKVLSTEFLDRWPDAVINIHHSFLPSFKGARPYHQAWERGVKVIGATAHYATADLDEGPIIAQDVLPVSHQHSAEMMVESGSDIERRVLTEAVLAHLEHRIVIHGARTIVFHPDGLKR